MKDEYQLPDDIWEDIKKERSTYKKAALITAKVKELESKKAGATTKEDKGAFQKQIDELTKALAEKENALTEVKNNSKKELADFKKNIKLESLFSNYKTIFDDLPAETKALTIKNILFKELQDNDVDFILDDKESLDLLKKDGTAYLGPNHQRITTNAFIDSVLAKNKILKTTEAAPAATQYQQGNAVAATKNGLGVRNLIDEQINALDKNKANSIIAA